MAHTTLIFRRPLLIWLLCLSLGLTALSPTVIVAQPTSADSPTTPELINRFQTGSTDGVPQTISPTAIGNVDALANVPLKGWTPSLQDAQVDRFSGAFSWDYDFDLPNGPAGIKPDLHLTYNSRRPAVGRSPVLIADPARRVGPAPAPATMGGAIQLPLPIPMAASPACNTMPWAASNSVRPTRLVS